LAIDDIKESNIEIEDLRSVFLKPRYFWMDAV
jgi:hypothetical protein